MSYEELLGWMDYFSKRPVGWREDDRTLKLLQIQGFKGHGETIFESLALMKAVSEKKKESEILDLNNLKKSFLFHKMSSAVGGVKLDL